MEEKRNIRTLLLGDEVPNFKAPTNQGDIQFHDYIKNSWAILFSHPRGINKPLTLIIYILYIQYGMETYINLNYNNKFINILF